MKVTLKSTQIIDSLPDDFYDKLKPRLFRRIGRELHLARRVLDLGCGSCSLGCFLAKAYHQWVIGVDSSSSDFPVPRNRSKGGRVQCLKRDAGRLDFLKDESVDAAVSMWALHEMDDPEAVFAQAYNLLRPGGEFLILDFPRNSLAQRLWNENYYKPVEFERFLSNAGFANIMVKLVGNNQVIWARGYRPTLNVTRDE